MSQVYAESGQD